MGPDTTSTVGDIYVAPVGAALDDRESWQKLGVVADGFTLLGEAVEAAGEAFDELNTAMKQLSWTVELHHRTSAVLTKMFFGPRLPKRSRRAYDSALLYARKRERAEFREAQRRAIGITR